MSVGVSAVVVWRCSMGRSDIYSSCSHGGGVASMATVVTFDLNKEHTLGPLGTQVTFDPGP